MLSLLTSAAGKGQWLVLSENEAGRFRFRDVRLCPESGNAVECRLLCHSQFQRRQLKLGPFAMLGADFHEGVECAGRNVQSQALVEQPRDFAICPPFAAECTDQFAVGL
jgi:hypothetical protein